MCKSSWCPLPAAYPRRKALVCHRAPISPQAVFKVEHLCVLLCTYIRARKNIFGEAAKSAIWILGGWKEKSAKIKGVGVNPIKTES